MNMNIEKIHTTFFRRNLRDLMERVKFKGDRYIVETFGRPMMVLISYEGYLSVEKMLPHNGDTAPGAAAPIEGESWAD
jgi:hypothetical protein